MPISVWDEEGDFLSVGSIYPDLLKDFKILIASLNINVNELISIQDLIGIIKETIFIRFSLEFRDQTLVVNFKDKSVLQGYPANYFTKMLDKPFSVEVSEDELHYIVNVTLH